MAAARTLQRLASLYERVERMHSIELQAASAAVSEVESALAGERQVSAECALAGSSALLRGDGAGWQIAQARRDAGAARVARLAAWREDRTQTREEAAHVHRASRIRQRQLEEVVAQASRAAAAEIDRQAQAAADDRYLSRMPRQPHGWHLRGKQEDR